ncbi:MAG: acetate--CoA ligase family protein [Candidatus Eremiobacteraeota bacterium]|nr:acetate--CoA ligase family protein [Candidatus Eremiobacteraeota bacterium]
MQKIEISNEKILNNMFRPGSVAIVGASARPGSLGNTVMKKMLDFKYSGVLYPINPKTPAIFGIECYKNVSEIPGNVDLAVICVPSLAVLPVLDDCHKKGVKACVIISAGFKEVGPEGVLREEELKKKRKEYGMRILGPNCFGIINGDPEISMDCTFARNLPQRGHVGLISQSGAMGACILEDLKKTVMGFSVFVSLGNRSDFNENEALEYLAKDQNTKIIMMYLENFANPLKFIEAAQKVTKHKPLIVLKAGASEHGAMAAASHTGMLAQSDRMVDALIEKAGAIRVYSVMEMIHTANALYKSVLPAKEDLAIITNAGGFGVLAIDKAEKLNLKLAQLDKKTIEYLENNLPEEASCKNPVDLLGTAGKDDYAYALEGLLADSNVGGVVCNFGPPVMQSAEEIAEVVVEKARKHPEKPVLSVYMNRNRIMKAIWDSKDVYVSQFDYAEDAVWAYSQLLKYKKIKERDSEIIPDFNVDIDEVNRILNKVKEDGRDRLDFYESESVLKAYGIPVANSVLIYEGDDLNKKLKNLTLPVAIKPASGAVTHKTELNAVELNLMDTHSIEASINRIGKRISDHDQKKYSGGFIVQEMVTDAREVIMGAVKQDAGIHLVMFGLGGIFVELLKDVAFAIPPISPIEAKNMLEKIKAYPLLEGFRGQKGVCLEDLYNSLMRLSLLVANHPGIKELDINPFMASAVPGNSKAVDVRIIL